MSFTVSETDILLGGMKITFKSSDYYEQVRLLTLSPPYWVRPQIQKFSSCTEWQARKAIARRNSLGTLTKVTNFSGNPLIDLILVEEIEAFFKMIQLVVKPQMKKK